MVNRRVKGNNAELEVRKKLIEEDYLVEKKNPSRWQSNDFWYMFDVIALRRDGSEIRLIQVKTNKNDSYKARKQIAKWIRKERVENISCEVWLKIPRKGYDIFVIESDK